MPTMPRKPNNYDLNLRTSPSTLITNTRVRAVPVTAADVEKMMWICRSAEDAGSASQRREMNRLTALRSRLIRKERLQNDRDTIIALQQNVRLLVAAQNQLMQTMTFTAEMLSGSELVLIDNYRTEDLVERIADNVEQVENTASAVMQSSSMHYFTDDIDGCRKEEIGEDKNEA